MKFYGDRLKDKEIFKNRKRLLDKQGIDINQVVSAGLVHGNNIEIVSRKDRGQRIINTDGLLTKDKNVFLSITVADCLPIFIYDYKNQVIGLIHGGWKSLAKNILSLAIQKLVNNFESQPQNILVGIGPGIGVCHFEVKDDVLQYWKVPPPNNVFRREEEKIFLDLKKVAKIQLLNLGLKEKNIEINPECTFCLADKYFSYRREKILNTMMAIIGKKGKI